MRHTLFKISSYASNFTQPRQPDFVVRSPLPLLLMAGMVLLGACDGSYPAGPAATAALVSDENVEVSQGDWIVFTPTSTAPESGWIFYPGGKVAAEAYAPLVRKFAEAGTLAVIVPMPLDLAIMSPMAADGVVQAFPEISTWGIAGHSLGGVAATQFAFERPDVIDALALYAAYPQEQHNLSDSQLPVLSLAGEVDQVLNWEKYEQTKALLPSTTRFELLEGANHSQFGDYGPQDGDGVASLTPDEQWSRAVEMSLALFDD